MKITFLGTSGWYDNDAGNTICTLIETKTHYIVLDAGFGFAKLQDYLKANKPVYLFLSHFHLDHICGLHTLPKLEIKELTILGQPGTKETLDSIIRHPFGVGFSELKCKVNIIGLEPGKKHEIPFAVTCLPLKHADESFGYRFELDGKTLAYCADTSVCFNDEELSRGVDCLIHENAGDDPVWGHTGPEKAASLARRAGAKKLVLTHLPHGFDRRIEAAKTAQSIFPETVIAYDGQSLEI